MTLGSNTQAKVDFVTYVKRNHKILQDTKTPKEVVAFQEKKMFREIASAPEATPLKEDPKVKQTEPTPADQGLESPASSDDVSPNR